MAAMDSRKEYCRKEMVAKAQSVIRVGMAIGLEDAWDNAAQYSR
jgi:uncharacterized Fe-S cluster-containing MiaB family protein